MKRRTGLLSILFLLPIILIVCLSGLGSCVSYKLSGATIPYDTIKTFTVINFSNESGSGPASLSQQFTEKLRQFYQTNTKLQLVNSNADWIMEGNIVKYELTSVSPQANQTASSNRLTIGVEFILTDNKRENRNIKQVFSFYDDFPQGVSLSQVESEKIETILSQIVLDIYNKTANSTW